MKSPDLTLTFPSLVIGNVAVAAVVVDHSVKQWRIIRFIAAATMRFMLLCT